MKNVFALILAIWAFCVGAADLVTKSGQLYSNYKIKKVDENAVTVVYLTKDGLPDSAEIAIADLPDTIAGALGVSAPAAEQADGFEKELADLGNALHAELAALDPNDRLARTALLSEVRSQARSLLMRYSEIADFRFIRSDDNGVLAAVVGTEKGGFLKSGDVVYIRGGLPPVNKQFRARIYPGGLYGNYGNYNVYFYGANETYAQEIMLEALGRSVGNSLLFKPPTEEKPIVIDNTTINNITNVYVKERYPVWYSGGYCPRVIVRRPSCPEEEKSDKKSRTPSGKTASGTIPPTTRPVIRPGLMAIPVNKLVPQSVRSGNQK